ncbi:hypothetical protein Tco_0260377 [Tanacetum coccineum]
MVISNVNCLFGGLSEFKVNSESKSNKGFVIVILKLSEIESRESKGFSDTLGIGTGSSIPLRGLNLISLSPIKKVLDGSLIRGSIYDFFAFEGGIESRERKASVSSKRESLSSKGVRDGKETRQLDQKKEWDCHSKDESVSKHLTLHENDTTMPDYEDSTVTYTAISSPFGGLSDIRSPGAPPSPDYVPGPEYPPLPEFVLEPVYPEFMPLEDEVFPVEEQPLPAATSCTADSPGYVPESDPEEGDDEDPEEDPADYPVDGGDDDDDEDESSDNDEDTDDVDIEDEEEEEHLALVDSTSVAFPAVEHAPSAEETEPFETDESAATPPPHPAYRVTARISIRPHTLVSLPLDTEIPSSPLPPILSPLLVSSPLPVSPPLPLAPPPLPSRLTVVTLPASKRLGIALSPRYKVGESSSAPTARPPGGAPATDDTELGRRMTKFATLVRQDTDEIYTRDRRAHACTALLMEREARMSRKAWGRSMDASDLARSEVMSLHTTILGQQAVIIELQAADRRKQAAITELLAADRRRQVAITKLLAADRRRQAQFIEALKLLKRLHT